MRVPLALASYFLLAFYPIYIAPAAVRVVFTAP